jgi:hypothetical protein
MSIRGMRKLYHSEEGTSSKFGHKYFALALTATPKDRYNQYTYSLAVYAIIPLITVRAFGLILLRAFENERK